MLLVNKTALCGQHEGDEKEKERKKKGGGALKLTLLWEYKQMNVGNLRISEICMLTMLV